jgi:hypothetical protein
MRRQPGRAAASLVALLLLLTSLGTALGAHRCPHHDGATAAGEAAGHVPGHGPEAGHGHEHDGDPGSEAHGSCTCVGECQAGSAPSMPAPAVGAALSAPPATSPASLPVRPLHRATIVPFSLPWGNAPPTL